jgi:hypothetical protein
MQQPIDNKPVVPLDHNGAAKLVSSGRAAWEGCDELLRERNRDGSFNGAAMAKIGALIELGCSTKEHEIFVRVGGVLAPLGGAIRTKVEKHLQQNGTNGNGNLLVEMSRWSALSIDTTFNAQKVQRPNKTKRRES